jgi:urease accessory protein
MDSDQTIGTAICSPSSAGVGQIELVKVAGRTVVTRSRANSPLRLLTPRNENPVARVFAGSYGGGLVGGDAIDLTVRAGSATRCLLSTQASTKVYRATAGGCTQHLIVTADADSIIASLPDPVVCFSGSRFRQRQQFDLTSTASLVMLDWFTSGRAARGERWAMHQYASHTEIAVAGETVFRDVLELDPGDGEIGGAMRMRWVNCFATVVMVGPAFVSEAKRMVAAIQNTPMATGGAILFGASQLPTASVLRVAGCNAETVGNWLRDQLSFVSGILGMDPWNRKW